MKNGMLVFLIIGVIAGCEASSNDNSHTTRKKNDLSMRVQRSLFEDGKTVFLERCAVCHGKDADGTGPMAQTIESPKPADFHESTYVKMPVDSIRRVIVQGGEATGKNPRMPAWGEELTDKQIEAVIAFIRSVSRFGQVPTGQQIRDASWVVD